MFLIRSSQSDSYFFVWLIYVAAIFVQMSSVDVFVVGGARETNHWEDISRKAIYLDRDDFLPTRYMSVRSLKLWPPRLHGQE